MSEQRKPNGQWAKGHSGNEGNTSATYKAKMLAVVKDAVTADDWTAITGRAVTLARAGNNEARNWLSSYLLGKPEENMPIALYPVSVDDWWARVEERQNDSES